MISALKSFVVLINVRSLQFRRKEDTSPGKMHLPAKEQLPESTESYTSEMHPDHPWSGGNFKNPLFLRNDRTQYADHIMYLAFKDPRRPGLTNKAQMWKPDADLLSNSYSHPSSGNYGNTCMILEQFVQIRQIWRGFHTLQFIQDLMENGKQLFRKFFHQIPYAMKLYGKPGRQRSTLNCTVQSMKSSFCLFRAFLSVVAKHADHLPQALDSRTRNISTSGKRRACQYFIQGTDLLKRAAGIHRSHLPSEHKDFTEQGKLFLRTQEILLGRHSGAQVINVPGQTFGFWMRSIDQEYQYSTFTLH